MSSTSERLGDTSFIVEILSFRTSVHLNLCLYMAERINIAYCKVIGFKVRLFQPMLKNFRSGDLSTTAELKTMRSEKGLISSRRSLAFQYFRNGLKHLNVKQLNSLIMITMTRAVQIGM